MAEILADPKMQAMIKDLQGRVLNLNNEKNKLEQKNTKLTNAKA